MFFTHFATLSGILLAVSLLAVSFTGCRTIEEKPTTSLIDEPSFAIADLNDDGKLSKRELAKYKHQEALAEFDLNNDGMISAEEWAAAKPSAGENDEHFNRLDKNSNGHIEEEEAILFVSEHVSFSDIFKKLDSNGDDHLHWEEFAEAEPSSVNLTLFSLRG